MLRGMMNITVLLNTNSNIIEQQDDLRIITSIGDVSLGPLCGQYRSIKNEPFNSISISNFFKKISEINYQAIADNCTMVYGTGNVITLPPIITKRGILVNYNRINRVFIRGNQFISEFPEVNALFLKVIMY